MPHTLDHVRHLLVNYMSHLPPADIQLLVVPGLDWSDSALAQLRAWQSQGYELAGHGWTHEASAINGWYHKLHSLFVSRNAAEHLALDQEALCALIEQNYHWFEQNQLAAPALYVPPAWALGSLSKATLQQLPYRYYEVTKGFIKVDDQEEQVRRLPLTGYEADHQFRQWFLGTWNVANAAIASPKRPLRVSIHPYDYQYRLSKQLTHCLLHRIRTVHYRSVFDA